MQEVVCKLFKQLNLATNPPIKFYFEFSLASITARIKETTVKGILTVKITLVTTCPNSGVPEVNSKIEPTQAIAAKQESSNKIPLLGVIYINFSRVLN